MKSYSIGVAITLWLLFFLAEEPGLISGMGFDFYIGVLWLVLYPISMYYLIKLFLKTTKQITK